MENKEERNNMKFSYMASVLYQLFSKVGYKTVYEKLWNPINYACVGGIGVLINYLIFAMLISLFPWWITNAIAILVAWSWNWGMSVGPLGYLWGFKKKGGEK